MYLGLPEFKPVNGRSCSACWEHPSTETPVTTQKHLGKEVQRNASLLHTLTVYMHGVLYLDKCIKSQSHINFAGSREAIMSEDAHFLK